MKLSITKTSTGHRVSFGVDNAADASLLHDVIACDGEDAKGLFKNPHDFIGHLFRMSIGKDPLHRKGVTKHEIEFELEEGCANW